MEEKQDLDWDKHQKHLKEILEKCRSTTNEFAYIVSVNGRHERIMRKVSYSDQELYYQRFPSDNELSGQELFLIHWGYFEGWSPYRNYLVAKEHCRLEDAEDNNSRTFTDFAQNDQALLQGS